MAQELNESLRRRGIIHGKTARYHPAGNGTSERMNRTLWECTQTLMLASALPQELWPFAVKYACTVQNQSLMSKHTNKSPHEGLFKCKPGMSKLMSLGARCKVLRELHQNKLNAKTDSRRMIGRDENSDAYVVLLDTASIVNSRNATFETSAQKKQTSTDIPHRALKVNASTVDDDMPTPALALDSPEREKWREAMNSKVQKLIDNKTWEAVKEFPKDRKIVKSKFVLKRKRGADGEVCRYKARLVAKGFTQVEGVDYNETFAPVVRISTMLHTAIQNILIIQQIDIDNAYLNAELKEEIYMRLPRDLSRKYARAKIVRLRKTIYRLKQSGREWNNLLSSSPSTLGWTSCKADHCAFYRQAVHLWEHRVHHHICRRHIDNGKV